MSDGGSGTAANQREMCVHLGASEILAPRAAVTVGNDETGGGIQQMEEEYLAQPSPFCLRNPEEHTGPAAHAEVPAAVPLLQAQAGHTSETLRAQEEAGIRVPPMVAVTSPPSQGHAFPVSPSAPLLIAASI